MDFAIVLNGTPFNRKIEEPCVVCADGGFSLVKNKRIDYVVGDFDSLTSLPTDVKIIKVPSHKDFSDGELALLTAKDCGGTKIAIYGADGGRTDHIFANYSLLILAKELGVDAAIKSDLYDVKYFDSDFSISAKIGDKISFLPFGCNEVELSVTNVEYPLNRLKIDYISASRGLSNIALAENIDITVHAGRGLVFLFRH